MEELRKRLIRNFAYDLWANQKWVETLPEFPQAEPILRHVAWASHIWQTRVEAISGEYDHQAELADQFEAYRNVWQSTLASTPLFTEYEWRRIRDGVRGSGSLESIATHVINHGTYHRGHLRGLAEAGGFDDFPETDVILFEAMY